MKKSLITSGLLALAMLSASSAFAEANCQAHPKNEQIPQADFQKALEKYGANRLWVLVPLHVATFYSSKMTPLLLWKI